jgi:hypothetical protein
LTSGTVLAHLAALTFLHGPGFDTLCRSQHLLLIHGFPPSSSASTDSNCCPRPATSHISDAAASLARNRCTSRVSEVAAALAGPTHGLPVGKVGRLNCTGRLLAGRRGRSRWTGLPNLSNIAWHNQPMANAAMIEVMNQLHSDRRAIV